MSSAAQDHGYTIRWALEVEPGDNAAAMDALDALLAENERLQREVDIQTARKNEWFDEASHRGKQLSEALDELDRLRRV